MEFLSQIFTAIYRLITRFFVLLAAIVGYRIGPRITRVNPAVTYPGSVITITGSGFSDDLDGNSVAVGGQPARVIRASPTEVRVIASLDAVDGPIKVVTDGNTAISPDNFRARPYPLPGSDEDGPPSYFEGAADLLPGDLPSTGVAKVLVVLVNPTDLVPANPANARTEVINKWATVHTFYDQASFATLDLQVDVTTGWKTLLKDRDYYIDDVNQNVENSLLGQVVAEAAQAAVDDGKDLDDYGMMAVVMFLNNGFIRAWGGWSQQNFNYTDAPSGTNINIVADHDINLLVIQESADWGRFAHETGHNLVSAPSFQAGTIGVATLGEDVYDSDLIDPSEATAFVFEMMGDHDDHPLFSGYHMDKLGYYSGANVVDLQWDRNAFSQDIDVVANGLTKNTVVGRCHLIRLRVTDGLYYYIEVRQRPGMTAQVFDNVIPIGAAPHEGGVVVYKILMDTMNNNQQMRFITLLHDPIVLKQGDTAVDPARALTITVLDDGVVARPLVCRVRVSWAQGIADDPTGAFDLSIEPWNDNYESPDIWVDRPPFGTFDKPNDAQGRPTGNGDKPQPLAINNFTTRVHNQGTVDANNVKVTFYTVTPPGVGDNGNWTPLRTITVANVPQNGSQDVSTNWVPVVGEHTCLRVFVEQQLGEITGGNNWAQENVFEFTAPASTPEPQIIRVAVRNPRKEKSIVYVNLKNVPHGYIVQFPHQWLMMDALEERAVEVIIIPYLDYAAYAHADRGKQDRKTRRRADVRVVGLVPREYRNERTNDRPVGSRMFHIGGILASVTPKLHSQIELQEDRQFEKGTDPRLLGLIGHLKPAQGEEKVSVFLKSPHDDQWVLEVKTDAAGVFRAVFDLTTKPTLDTLRWQELRPNEIRPSGEIEPMRGVYKARAFLVNSPNAAESESNIVAVPKGL